MALASGQITIVDLNDITLQGFLRSSQPKIQFLATNGTTYTPDWSVLANNVVIDAEVYQMGDSTNYMLNSAKATNVVWSYKLVGDSNFTTIASGTGGFTIGGTNNSKLTIAQNKMTASAVGMTIRCSIQYVSQPGITAVPYIMDIDFGLTRQGDQGLPGTAAKVINLNGTGQIFSVNTAGAVSPATIVVTADLQGSPLPSPTWTYSTDGGVTFSGTVPGGVVRSTNTVTVTGASLGVASLVIKATDGAVSDTYAINKVADGGNAITPIISNASHTLPASSAGVVSSFVNSGTTIQVFEGNTALQFNTVLAAGRFTIGTPVIAPAGKLTMQAITGSGTTTATVPQHTAMDSATDSVIITFPITVRKANGTDVSFNITQTVTKSKGGETPVVLSVWTPNGDTFANVITGNPSLTMQATLYEGVNSVAPTQTKWFYQSAAVTTTGSPGYDADGGLGWFYMSADVAGMYSGGTTQTATVYSNFIGALQAFKVVTKYGGKSYTDTVVIRDYTDPYQIILDSSNGTTFLDGNISTTITCIVKQNGEDIDSAGTALNYLWSKTDSTGTLDAGFTATTKSITISASNVSKKATFYCEVSKK